jgi:hypothetical protein
MITRARDWTGLVSRFATWGALAATCGARAAIVCGSRDRAATPTRPASVSEALRNSSDCALSYASAEAVSSALAALDCVTLSICVTAVLIWLIPSLCSFDAVAT